MSRQILSTFPFTHPVLLLVISSSLTGLSPLLQNSPVGPPSFPFDCNLIQAYILIHTGTDTRHSPTHSLTTGTARCSQLYFSIQLFCSSVHQKKKKMILLFDSLTSFFFLCVCFYYRYSICATQPQSTITTSQLDFLNGSVSAKIFKMLPAYSNIHAIRSSISRRGLTTSLDAIEKVPAIFFFFF
jgi:hypothetical protein